MVDWRKEINSLDLTHLDGAGILSEKGLDAPDMEFTRSKLTRDLTRRGTLNRYTTYTYVFSPYENPEETVLTKQTLLINEWKDITVGDFAQKVLDDQKQNGLDNDGVGVV